MGAIILGSEFCSKLQSFQHFISLNKFRTGNGYSIVPSETKLFDDF
jgi:hypothetical protein